VVAVVLAAALNRSEDAMKIKTTIKAGNGGCEGGCNGSVKTAVAR
jgi:hypothetical protein